MTHIIIFITASSQDEADKIGRVLVEEKLVACVNIIPGIKSIYWWKDKIECSCEIMIVAKSENTLFEKIEKRVKEIHSYEVPEIIALTISAGNKDYLQWITSSLESKKDDIRGE